MESAVPDAEGISASLLDAVDERGDPGLLVRLPEWLQGEMHPPRGAGR